MMTNTLSIADIFKSVCLRVAFSDQYVQLRKKHGNPQKFQSALKTLLNATNPYASSAPAEEEKGEPQPIECCICINQIAPYQALFISPCSHCFHYKCVSIILSQTTMFPCPMCRQVANLTASVSMESLTEKEEDDSPVIGSDSDVSVLVDEQGKIRKPIAIPQSAGTSTGRLSLSRQHSANLSVSPVSQTQPNQLRRSPISTPMSQSKDTLPENRRASFVGRISAFLHRKSVTMSPTSPALETGPLFSNQPAASTSSAAPASNLSTPISEIQNVSSPMDLDPNEMDEDEEAQATATNLPRPVVTQPPNQPSDEEPNTPTE